MIKTIVKHPRLIFPQQHIFLISHMRGNTSLLSHLLGNHPEIDGYYEMHIGYYSWKSLYRQKLLYLQDHTIKQNNKYFFDKVLHNEHYIADSILSNPKSKIIIMLREPEQTIRSIINLYRTNEPEHPYCTPDNAKNYYIDRIRYIKMMAEKIPRQFYYLQAETLRSNSEKELKSIQNWLGLLTPIDQKYTRLKNTGKEKYGDSSKNIYAGSIQRNDTDYSKIDLSLQLLSEAKNEYQLVNIYCESEKTEII